MRMESAWSVFACWRRRGQAVDARDKDGYTLLHKTYLIDVQEELLRLGADVNARNFNGETPIFTNMNTKSIPLFLQRRCRSYYSQLVVSPTREYYPSMESRRGARF